MRIPSALVALSAVTLLSACASQATAPAKPAAAPATAPAAKAPQCWNGDAGAFQDIGTQATIAGVVVECKPSADGKSAQWMAAGAKR